MTRMHKQIFKTFRKKARLNVFTKRHYKDIQNKNDKTSSKQEQQHIHWPASQE